MSASMKHGYGSAAAGVSGWLRRNRLLLLAIGTLALVATAYWQSFDRMVAMWSLMNYEHCWLVVPISLYVLWRRRGSLAGGGMQGSLPGLLLVGLLVLVWIVARAVSVQAVEFAAATSLVFAAFWAVAGNRAAQKAAFPLLLLLAAVPVGEILVEPLMNLTAKVAGALLYVAGVPVFRNGTFLTLPGGSFEVAEVCSGLRYLLAGAMASLAYAYVTYHGFKKRLLFMTVSAGVLVLANGLRAFIVMYVASATEMRVFTGWDHVYFGMLLFTVIFLALVYFGERYADYGEPPPAADAPGYERPRVPLGTIAAVCLVLLAGPVFEHVKAQEVRSASFDASLPQLPGCNGPADWLEDWSPQFHGPDYVLRGSYGCGDVNSSVYFAAYLHEQQGSELINSSNRVWPHEWRRYVDERSIDLSYGAGAVDAREVLVHSPERSMLIWYWYRIDETITGSPLQVKLWAALHALSLTSNTASITAVATTAPSGADPESLRAAMAPVARAVLAWQREGAIR